MRYRGMRRAHKVWVGVAAATMVAVAVVDMSTGEDTDSGRPAPAAEAAREDRAGSGGYDGSAASAVGLVGEGTVVTRVVDGDTLIVTGDRRVRVLGIDSCEMSTSRGPDAQRHAASLVLGESVTLTAEPGVDTDRYGRMLRYVQVNSGSDFGLSMAPFGHTGVYEGRNDAGEAYLVELREADSDGRDCGGERAAQEAGSSDDRDRRPEPGPDRSGGDSGRTGDSGHPCLPGERDGDGDGWCGES